MDTPTGMRAVGMQAARSRHRFAVPDRHSPEGFHLSLVSCRVRRRDAESSSPQPGQTSRCTLPQNASVDLYGRRQKPTLGCVAGEFTRCETVYAAIDSSAVVPEDADEIAGHHFVAVWTGRHRCSPWYVIPILAAVFNSIGVSRSRVQIRWYRAYAHEVSHCIAKRSTATSSTRWEMNSQRNWRFETGISTDDRRQLGLQLFQPGCRFHQPTFPIVFDERELR